MRNRMSYQNFNVAVYCPVGDVNRITDFRAFEEKFRLLSDHVKVGRVYLECYRSEEWCTKDHLLEVKDFFESRGIATSGGITTCADSSKEGFASLCYSTPKDEETLRKAVALNSNLLRRSGADVCGRGCVFRQAWESGRRSCLPSGKRAR
ncbi:MAG: hypothetical protein LUH20_08510 [Lachnospiraceae bacterium]|nr:hypothetical protein [Lachnospiraceae bacterium]